MIGVHLGHPCRPYIVNVLQGCFMALGIGKNGVGPQKAIDIPFIGKAARVQLGGNLICDLIEVHQPKTRMTKNSSANTDGTSRSTKPSSA